MRLLNVRHDFPGRAEKTLTPKLTRTARVVFAGWYGRALERRPSIEVKG
jgi:hypothetical protein